MGLIDEDGDEMDVIRKDDQPIILRVDWGRSLSIKNDV